MSDAEYKRLRQALAAKYADASEAVSEILYSREAQAVTLNYEGRLYNGKSLRDLALLIANQKVLAFIVGNTTDIPKGSEAKYHQDLDTILLRRQPTDAYTKSAVIHECIHAINDDQERDMTNAINEKHAFIFQALYLRNLHVTGKTLLAGGTRDIIFPPAAFDVADSIMSGKAVSLSDVVHLEQTLQANSEYASILAKKSPNDGIRR
jgi:hypothetical protein